MLCILAAGRGTRAQSSIHKALLPIENKAIISHIIEKVPGKVIIAVGYQQELIKDYCLAAHPDREFIFVTVDNFDGPGSGPGHSLLCCKEHLQCPFYLSTADCLVAEDWPALDSNWLGVYPVTNPEPWATVKLENSMVTACCNKRADGFADAWIGLCGIKDYRTFWDQIAFPSEDKEYEVVRAFYNPHAYPMRAIPFTWYDTGTSDSYFIAQCVWHCDNIALPKSDEFIYHCGDRCVKIFSDSGKAAFRIARANYSLSDVIPDVIYEGKHGYAYKWQDGKTLYEHNNVELYNGLLKWCKDKLWHSAPNIEDFDQHCLSFYKDKTERRVHQYLLNHTVIERPWINGWTCPSVNELLNSVDWQRLSRGVPVNFHGDLQYDNVIYSDDYCLIDWRDSFDGLMFGDIYYDLGKLYAGICLSMYDLKTYKCKTEINGNEVLCHMRYPGELCEAERFFSHWVVDHKLDFGRILIISGLIYLNMAPLHPAPISEFLYYFGQLTLHKALVMIEVARQVGDNDTVL